MNKEFIPFADIGAAIDYYYDKPVAFCQDILHLDPDEWQDQDAKFQRTTVNIDEIEGITSNILIEVKNELNKLTN